MKKIHLFLIASLFHVIIQAQVEVIQGKVGLGTRAPQHDIHMQGDDLLFRSSEDTGLQIRMYIDENGRVGIGTMAPTSKLSVHGDLRVKQSGQSYNGGLKLTRSNNAVTSYLWTDSADKLRIYGGSAGDRDILLNGPGTGKVGIGTITPGNKVEISGPNFANGALRFNNVANSGAATYWEVGERSFSASNTRFEVNQNGNARLTIDKDGHVGLGTETPAEKLDVNGLISGGFGAQSTAGVKDWNDVTNARSGNGRTLLLGSNANGPGGGAYFHPFSFEYSAKNGSGNMTQMAVPYNSTGLNRGMYMRTRYSGNWTSWSKILMENTSGNVGIGTVSPSQKLDVAGTTKTENLIVTSGAGAGKVLQSDASGNASWVDASTIQTEPDNLGDHTANQNINLNGKWLSGDGDNEGMFVNSEGNLGIGTANPSYSIDQYTREQGDQTNSNARFRRFNTTSTLSATRSHNGLIVHNEELGVVGDYAAGSRLTSRGAVFTNIMRQNTKAYTTQGSLSQALFYGNNGVFSLQGSSSTATVGGGATGTVERMYATVNSTSIGNTGATVKGATGSHNYLIFNNQNKINNVYGVNSWVRNWTSSGDVGNAYGLKSLVSNDSNLDNTMTNVYGLQSYILNNSATGHMTNSYGVYARINNRTTGTSQNAKLFYGRMDGKHGTEYGLYLDDIHIEGNGDHTTMKHYVEGNFGLGVTNPGNPLAVNRTLSTNIAGASFIFPSVGGEGSGIYVRGGGTGSGRYILSLNDAANNSRFNVLSNGKVGIGLSNPAAKLDMIAGRGANSGIKINDGLDNNNRRHEIRLSNSGNGVIDIYNNQNELSTSFDAGGNSFIKNGNFGIGTSAPSERLDVVGTTKTQSLHITDGAGAGKVLQSDATGLASWVDVSTLPIDAESLGIEQLWDQSGSDMAVIYLIRKEKLG